MKHIPGHASELKTDTEYTEAAATALTDIAAIGEQLEPFTDDFDIRIVYNKLFQAHATLNAKVNRA